MSCYIFCSETFCCLSLTYINEWASTRKTHIIQYVIYHDPLVRTSPRFHNNSDISVTIQPPSSVKPHFTLLHISYMLHCTLYVNACKPSKNQRRLWNGHGNQWCKGHASVWILPQLAVFCPLRSQYFALNYFLPMTKQRDLAHGPVQCIPEQIINLITENVYLWITVKQDYTSGYLKLIHCENRQLCKFIRSVIKFVQFFFDFIHLR